jgi:hypothetical protein
MQELREAYPEEITSMESESSFLDPPTLHIETNIRAGEEHGRFACHEIWPRVRGAGIDVTVGGALV